MGRGQPGGGAWQCLLVTRAITCGNYRGTPQYYANQEGRAHYWVGKVVERFVAERPDFKQYHSIAPYITGTRVLVVVQRLCRLHHNYVIAQTACS